MDELIEALRIFGEYQNCKYPISCEHEVLYICGVDPHEVSLEDKEKLRDLSFFVEESLGCFTSYRFGSC